MTATGGTEPEADLASTLPELLLLLADMREQWERARQELAGATVEAQRSGAQVDELTEELEATVEQLRIAEARREMTEEYAEGLKAQLESLRRAYDEETAERDRAGQVRDAAEAESERLRVELVAAKDREDEARGRLNELLSSSSWRITQPFRAVVDRLRHR